MGENPATYYSIVVIFSGLALAGVAGALLLALKTREMIEADEERLARYNFSGKEGIK